MMNRQSALALAVTHLNASVGPVLCAEQLASALRAGSVRHVAMSSAGAALVGSMFTELPPSLILRCASEAYADVHSADRLYQEALADGLPPVREWEMSVEHLL